MRYRATYVIERELEEDMYELLFSASVEQTADDVMSAHDPLLESMGERIESLKPMLSRAEDDPEPPHIETVPNTPTIMSVNEKKE